MFQPRNFDHLEMQLSAQFLTVIFVSRAIFNCCFCQPRKFGKNIRFPRALSKLSNLAWRSGPDPQWHKTKW